MNQAPLGTLVQRLDRLERHLRRWRVLGIVAMIALGLVFLLGATSPKAADEIRAKRFVLVDEDGRVRAMLHLAASRFAGLQLYDQSGRSGAFLFTWPEGGAALTLLDSALKERVNLSVSERGSAALHLASLDKGREVLWKAP